MATTTKGGAGIGLAALLGGGALVGYYYYRNHKQSTGASPSGGTTSTSPSTPSGSGTSTQSAPTVRIDGFNNNQSVTSSSLKVSVPHTAADTVHLWLNGVYQSGNGYYTLTLKNGKNVISAQVIDNTTGLKSRIEHKYVNYSAPKYPIPVSIYGFTDNSTTTNSTLNIRVPHTSSQIVHVWLNGIYQSGSGSYTLHLKSGKNLITAQIVDANNSSITSREEHKYITLV